MKKISQKQLDKLEDALNHLYEIGCYLVTVRDIKEVDEALKDLKSAGDLMFEVLDPLR